MFYRGTEVKEILDSYCGLILDGIKRICWGWHGNIEWDGSFLQLAFRGGRSVVLKTDPSEMMLCISDKEWGEVDNSNMHIYDVTEDAPFAKVIGERLVSNEYYEADYGFVIGVKMIFESKCIRFITHYCENTFIVVDNIGPSLKGSDQ